MAISSPILSAPLAVVTADEQGLAMTSRVSWALAALFTALILAMNAVTTPGNWAAGPLHPSPISHAMPEEDFSNLWAAGKLARAGGLPDLYGAKSFQQYKVSLFGPGLQEEDWVYPPTVLLLGVPFSLLPLPVGFFLWDAGTLVLAVLLLRWARLSWPILAAGLAGPASWRCLTLGQYGVATGAMVVAGLLAAPRHPLRAGLLLGLSTLKPQQGLIVPVAWLAARRFQAIGAGAVTVAVLAALVAAAFGLGAWPMFLARSGALVRGLLEAPPPQNYISDGISVFWMLRTAEAGIAAAYAGQAAAALAAGVMGWMVWRKPTSRPLPRVALTVCLSLFATPYGFTSDMVAMTIALAIVVAGRGWRLTPLDAAIWLWPAYCPLVTLKTGLLLTPVAVLIVAVMAWRQTYDAEASALAPP
jgi:hypothetical protein